MSLTVTERQQVKFERGFKTWSENTAASLRRQLNLKDIDPLPPRDLASNLGVIVWHPADVPGLSQEALVHLTSPQGDEWSAVTVRVGSQDVIVLNPCHSSARQASDLTHEMAHIVRGHNPAQLIVLSEVGVVLREYDELQEAEANWLAGCILLPRPALSYCAYKKFDNNHICDHYGISQELLRYRMNVSGVAKQFGYMMN